MTTSNFTLPSDPHLRRWMSFVDGENFAIRAKEWASENKINLQEGKYYKEDIFVWFPNLPANLEFTNGTKKVCRFLFKKKP